MPGETRARLPDRLAAAIVAAMIVIPLLQLIPVPPGLWSRLPGRERIVETFAILGQNLPWLPISVEPRATWLALLALLPPLAVFVAVVQLDRRERQVLSVAVVAFGALSVLLGLLQVAQGPESALRFYAVTNPTEAVGFFANRNHLASLLVTATLLAVAWTLVAGLGASRGTGRMEITAGTAVALIGGSAMLVLFFAGQMMTRSRAGLGLGLLALLAAFVLPLRLGVHKSTPIARWAMLLLAVSVVFAAPFGMVRVLARFGDDPLADARFAMARNTLAAARAHLPTGSGVGTFVPVYGQFERPTDLLASYANRAHNDVLEVLLETGLPGAVLLIAFAFWLANRGLAAWRRSVRDGEPIDIVLTRTAVLIVILLLAHSVVDYPLRTSAIAALFAMACAFLVPPPQPIGVEGMRGESLEPPAPRERARAPRPMPSPFPAKADPPAAAVVDWAWPSADEARQPDTGGQSHAAAPRTAAPGADEPAAATPAAGGDGQQWPEEWRAARGSDRPSPPDDKDRGR